MNRISRIWDHIQATLFPFIEKIVIDPLTEKQRRLVAILELIQIDQFVPRRWWHL